MLIGGFQPFTLSDFPGKTAAIVFTQGCNFRCPYCHNRSLWRITDAGSETCTLEGILSFLKQRRGLLQGVVVTGGEPTTQPDLADFLGQIKGLDLAVKLDTNGSNSEVMVDLLDASLVNYVAMDVKAPVEKYELLCGVKVDTAAIRRTIDLISASGVPHHFRTTFYRPRLSSEDLTKLKRLLPLRARHVTQEFRDPPLFPTDETINTVCS